MGEDAKLCWLEAALENNIIIPEPNMFQKQIKDIFK